MLTVTALVLKPLRGIPCVPPHWADAFREEQGPQRFHWCRFIYQRQLIDLFIFFISVILYWSSEENNDFCLGPLCQHWSISSLLKVHRLAQGRLSRAGGWKSCPGLNDWLSVGGAALLPFRKRAAPCWRKAIEQCNSPSRLTINKSAELCLSVSENICLKCDQIFLVVTQLQVFLSSSFHLLRNKQTKKAF